MPMPAAAYTNLHEVKPPARRSRAADMKAAAAAQREAETRLKRKIDQANGLLDAIEERQTQIGKQIKELQRRKKSLEQRGERIEDRILAEMSEAQTEKVSGLRHTFSSRLAPAALAIDNEALIPDEYMNEKVVSTPDKVAIKVAIAAGENVPGVRLTQKVSLIRS